MLHTMALTTSIDFAHMPDSFWNDLHPNSTRYMSCSGSFCSRHDIDMSDSFLEWPPSFNTLDVSFMWEYIYIYCGGFSFYIILAAHHGRSASTSDPFPVFMPMHLFIFFCIFKKLCVILSDRSDISVWIAAPRRYLFRFSQHGNRIVINDYWRLLIIQKKTRILIYLLQLIKKSTILCL